MTKWISMSYTNDYRKNLKHHCSIRGLEDVKEVCSRYNIKPEDVTEVVIDGRVANIEKVRESLK